MAEEANLQEDVQTIPSDPFEGKAREQGWKPLEEWDKDPEDWVDAKTFVRNGEYMERIKSQSSLIKRLEKRQAQTESTLKELAEHHTKVKEFEYERALKDLKALKKEALDLGDHDTVVDIDDRILDLKESNKKQPVSVPTDVDQEVSEWIEENSWYSQDMMLHGAANGIISDILKKEPHLEGQAKELLDRATAKLKEEFPSKFGIKPKDTRVTEPSNTEGATRPTKVPKYTAKHLNDEQIKAGKRFVERGAFKSLDDYAAELGKIGGLDTQNK